MVICTGMLQQHRIDDRTVNSYDRSNPFAGRIVPSVELKDEVTNSPRTADTSPQRTRRF